MNDKIKEAIIKKLNGDSDMKTEVVFSEWLSRGNHGLFSEYSNIWRRAAMINRNMEVDIDEAWSQVLGRRKVSWYTSNVFKMVASVLLLFISSVAIYYYQVNQMEVYQADSKVKTVILPDGSQVTLNIGASISYKKDFQDQYREVTLYGEAFFDVVKDPEKAFFVETETGHIIVLGTSFNLNTNESNTRLDVVSGLVKMSNADFSSSQLFQKGESGEISLTEDEVIKVSPNTNAMSWLSRELVFDNALGSDVIADISKFYNLNINLENESIGSCRLTSSYKNKTLKEVLDELRLLWGISYTIDGNVVMLSGVGCNSESRVQ